MADLSIYFASAISALTAFGAGWWLRGLRRPTAAADVEDCEWQVLEIKYRNKDRTTEWYRHLGYTRYSTFEEAQREAERREGEDTLKNVFSNEYVVVKAP